MADAIVLPLNALTRYLHTAEPEKNGWKKYFSNDWISWMLIYLILWVVSIGIVMYCDRQMYITNEMTFNVVLALLWIMVATWHAKSRKHKQEELHIRKHLTLYEMLIDLFRACGWMDEDDESKEKRRLVTSAHMLAICEITASYRSRNSVWNKSGVTLELMLRTANEQKWWEVDRLELLFIRLEQVHEQYEAAKSSLSEYSQLNSVGPGLLANCAAGLAAAHAEFKAVDRMVSKLPLQHNVDAIPMPPAPNGFTQVRALRLARLLAATAKPMNSEQKKRNDSLRLSGLLQQNDKGELVPNGECPPQPSGGMEKS